MLLLRPSPDPPATNAPAQSLSFRGAQLANPLISTHDLLREQWPAQDRRLVLLMSESGRGISDNRRVIPKVVRKSRRTFHARVGRHSNDHHILDISLAKLIVDVCALKG